MLCITFRKIYPSDKCLLCKFSLTFHFYISYMQGKHGCIWNADASLNAFDRVRDRAIA